MVKTTKPEKNQETKPDLQYNYDVVVAGEEVNLVAKTMNEIQARDILEHYIKAFRLKNCVFSCKRLTPEPFDPVNLTQDYTPSTDTTLFFNNIR